MVHHKTFKAGIALSPAGLRIFAACRKEREIAPATAVAGLHDQQLISFSNTLLIVEEISRPISLHYFKYQYTRLSAAL